MANTNLAQAVRDTLVGDRYGIDLIAENPGGSRLEILVGDRYGIAIIGELLPGQTRELLVGDGYGVEWKAGIATVIREVLIAEPPFKLANAVMEHLVRIENEPLSVHRQVAGYQQSVVMVRPTMALPSTVKSPQIVPTLRQQAVVEASREWARSTDFAMTLRAQVTMRRVFNGMELMRSAIRVHGYVQQVVRSRGKTYVAVSGLFVASQRQQVVQMRVVSAPVEIRSAIDARTLRHMTLTSRKTVTVIITTEAHVASLVQQAVVEDTRPAPHSEIAARRLYHMTVQRHDVVPPGIDDRVAQYGQQVTMRREISTPFGSIQSATIRQQVVKSIERAMHWSFTEARSIVSLTVQHRDTYGPAFALGRHAASLAQQVTMDRVAPMHHSITEVGALQLSFVLDRDMPHPRDVIDPTIGRHAYTLSMMTVQHRVTSPPQQVVKDTHFVYQVATQAVLGDAFPLPDMPPPVIPEQFVYQVGQQIVLPDLGEWALVSSEKVRSVGQQVVVGDNAGWIDASVPQSEILTYTAAQAIAIGDVFPGSMVVQSAAEVAMLGQAVAVGDVMPDPFIPASEIQASALIEMAAVGDAQFPDPTIPLSEVRSALVASSVAVHDPSLAGSFGMSEISMTSVLEFLIIRDRSLVGIPLRQGPRPIITVSMS